MIQESTCKINIGLNIVGKRADGYHNLESLFYPVRSLSDLVEVVLSDESGVQFSQSGLVVDCPLDDNLCVKAYRAFAARYAIGGVKIHLHKRIPFGAGIGGGSSNAAAVIRLLNILFSIRATDDQLCEIAKKVGSDVPFFIYDRPLMVRGTGDLFSEIDIDLTGKYLTIVKPNFGISTKEAYARITPQEPNDRLEELLQGDIRGWRGVIKNDFEAVVCNDRMVEIREMLYDLGADYVSMSGSGSAMYAISDRVLDLNLVDEFYHQGVF